MALPSVKLNEKELENYQETMRKGAANLKQLAETTGMEHRELRARLFKKEFNPADWPELTTDQVAMFVQALPAIRALRNIEWRLLCAFSRLAKKHANAWAKKARWSRSDYDDFEQEAVLALLDAIYTYTQDDTKFVTYAWWVIRNRLANVANKSNPLGALTNEALKLITRFDEAKSKFNGPVTDDEVYQSMNLTPDEIQTIRDASVKCLQAARNGDSQFLAMHEDEYLNDYTAARRGIDTETDTVPCNYEIREALEHANLSPLERRVVETSLYPHYGWQQEIADETINQATGRPYSRARINQVLQIALNKVKAAYLKRNVA